MKRQSQSTICPFSVRTSLQAGMMEPTWDNFWAMAQQ
jgi:hypothetical protein